MLKDQGTLINGLDWDYLIILDALRYDYSEEFLKYFDGELTKVRSRGSCTGEWLAKTFNRCYDLTYISANPYINSAGLPLDVHELWKNYSWGSWKSTEHFSRIVDVWDSGWNKELGTVRPENVNEECLKHRDDRMIVHYMQPHSPFLTLNHGKGWRRKEAAFDRKAPEGIALARLREWIGPKMERLIRTENVWRVRNILNLEPTWEGEKIWREEGMEGVKYHYRKNLIKALEVVSPLLEQLDGRIVITSDHGQGFERANGHRAETYLPELVEVPWFEVKM